MIGQVKIKEDMPLQDMKGLLRGFPGLDEMASRIKSALPEGWGGDINLDVLLSSASNDALVTGGDRLVGMRAVWAADDPAVFAFTAQLFGMLSVIPEPDQEMVERLTCFPGFERDGNIVAIDGVPVPVGEEQVRIFVNLRWRWLINPLASLHLVGLHNAGLVDAGDHAELMVEKGHLPHRRHLLGYDAVHTTDETQQKFLAYNLAGHRTNLVALQQHDFELFMAVWLRDFSKIRSLVKGKALDYLVEADVRTRRMQIASTRLIYGTAIMSEFERIFEITEFFRMDGGVTRQAIKRAIRSVSSMEGIHAGTTSAHNFVSGSVAHARSLHPTMNEYVQNISKDPLLNKVNAAFEETTTYWKSLQRLKKPSGEVPAMYFLGIEPQLLTATAIIMMIRNLKKLEKNFNYRNSKNNTSEERAEGPIFRLAVIIMANSCVPTAMGMTKQIPSKFDVSAFDSEAWLKQAMPSLIINPKSVQQYEVSQSDYENSSAGLAGPPIDKREFAENPGQTFASHFASAKVRADACPDVNQAGWTRGFHFQAWFTPRAEYGFLRKCCRFVQFSQNAKQRREKWTQGGMVKKNLPNYRGSPRTTFTGLPKVHPVENVHELLRPLFEKLQYADRIYRRGSIVERSTVDAFVVEVARLMPGISAVTVDPHMNEAIVYPIGTAEREFAAEAAWNF